MTTVDRQTALARGAVGEQLAQQEYITQGYSIIAVNFFNRTGKRMGEIDFVAINEKSIVFVEVKTRAAEHDAFGGGFGAVNFAKQRKLLKAVKLFLVRHQQYSHLRPRIDVCVIIVNPLDNTAKTVKILTNAVEDYS